MIDADDSYNFTASNCFPRAPPRRSHQCVPLPTLNINFLVLPPAGCSHFTCRCTSCTVLNLCSSPVVPMFFAVVVDLVNDNFLTTSDRSQPISARSQSVVGNSASKASVDGMLCATSARVIDSYSGGAAGFATSTTSSLPSLTRRHIDLRVIITGKPRHHTQENGQLDVGLILEAHQGSLTMTICFALQPDGCLRLSGCTKSAMHRFEPLFPRPSPPSHWTGSP
ncbi:hypothetical protein C8R47DRAFT_812434 [Mycena vitilis]|nr:hypothetical protein C8R47DRAFT_812434 [Mycena vitilis]